MYKTVYVLLVMGCLLLLQYRDNAQSIRPERKPSIRSTILPELDPPVVLRSSMDSLNPETPDIFLRAGPSADVTARSFGGSGMIRLWIRMIWFPRESLKDDEPIDANDLSYRVWMMYDDTYLYVAVEVLDDFWFESE